MYRKDAGRRFVECAELAACADNVADTGETAFAKSTWIHQDAPTDADFSAPIAGEVLAEVECRIDAISNQLEALADSPNDFAAGDDGNLDYLLDQFRILTFTVGGTMNRHMFTDGRGIPVGLLKSILTRFVELANRLSAIAGRADQRDDSVLEIQRQSRSVSQKMAIVIERLCGSEASDLMDDLEAILAEFEAIANSHATATRDPIGLLGQRFFEVLVQFEDAVRLTNRFAAFSERIQRVAEKGARALDRLVEQSGGKQRVEITRLHIRFGFAMTQLAIRCNDAAMPKHPTS